MARIEPAEATAATRVLSATGLLLARSSVIVLVLVAWELFARSGRVTMFMLPPLSAVLERIWSNAVSGDLFLNAGLTLYRAFAGFLIAAVAGIAFGALIARNAVGRWFFDPIISVGFPMPKIAFLPIVTLWLGFYDLSKISMVVFDAIFPVMTATIVGIQGVEKELIWSARNMGTKRHELMWRVELPAAMPQIFTGLQVAFPIALIVTIVCEMAMGGYGLGGAMMSSSRFADSRGVFAALVEIAVVGYVLVKGMSALRKRLLMWHPEASEPTTV